MSMQMQISDRCRLCATLSLTRLPDIEPETSNRISTLFQVQIGFNEADKLPRTICCHCLASVDAAWLFLERVHRAQRELLDCTLQKHYEIFDQQPQEIEITVDLPCILPEQYEDDNPNETWPDYPWICRVCGESFPDEQFYRRHTCFELHRRYFCVDCPKVFKVNYAKFIAHITEQHWERFQNHLLLQCDVCQRWFHSREGQEFHRDHEHPNAGLRVMLERPTSNRGKIMYACELCGKSYATKPNLDVHKRIHTGVKNFTCDQCGKSFSQKGNLAAHLLTHSTSRPFSCAVCDKTFKTLMRLRKHLDIHSGHKPYVCEVCGREFRERGTLRAHVRIHTGAMPYCCEYCGKSFRFKGVLTTHRRQHTGERPYSCLECQHHFTNWPNYNKHMVRRHNINTSVHTRKTPAIPATGRPQRNPPGTVLAQPQINNQHLLNNNQTQDTIVVDCIEHHNTSNIHAHAQQQFSMAGIDEDPLQQSTMVNNVDIEHQQHQRLMDLGHHSMLAANVDGGQQEPHLMLSGDDSLVNVVHMQQDLSDMSEGVVYQTAPTVIGGYYTTYNVGGIAHVVTQ